MKKLLILTVSGLLTAMAASSQAADVPLAERHAARGVACASCHTTMPPKAPKNDTCFACHGSYDKLADRTDKGDINPHASHVEDASCGDCHSGHKKPRLLCDQCHEFTNIKVP